MKAFRLLRYLAVACLALLFVACDKDELALQNLSSTVWEGKILQNRDGQDEIEYVVNLFVKEDNKLDLIVSDPNNSLGGRFVDTPYTLKGKVFTMDVKGNQWPQEMLRQSWFVVRLTDKEFNLEMDGGYRKMLLKRNR